jgi:hypothetical protein
MSDKYNCLVLLFDHEALDRLFKDVTSHMSVEGREGVILHKRFKVVN